MAGKEIDIGPTGRRVAANIKAVRQQRGMGLTTLSQALRYAGRPIPANGLARIEAGERRVDVEDLLVLASCLTTSVVELLQLSEEERTHPKALIFGNYSADVVDYDVRIGTKPQPPETGDQWEGVSRKTANQLLERLERIEAVVAKQQADSGSEKP